MDKTAKKTLNEKLKLPFIVALIGVLVLVIGMFLPYMTAVGRLAEEFDATNSDLKDVPMISMGRAAASLYHEEEGTFFNVVVIVLASLSALTALFVLLKKPIAVVIFELIAFVYFTAINKATKADFFGADLYAWGVGYYAIIIAFAIVFTSAIWMLVKKIAVKKELKAEKPIQPET